MRRTINVAAHEKNDQRGGGRQMKQDMRSVWDHSIAPRQEGMRFAEHDLIASSSLQFWSEKISIHQARICPMKSRP
jgi:hypothetical protein